MNIFVRGALFPHWTRKRSGGVVASVSVGVPWTGRVGPSGLVWTGCRERVGLDALGRTSRPEWVGPCTVWIRSFWFETAVPCPLFPALRAAAFRALFRCLLCLARTSLHPGVAFLCFGLLPSVLCFAVSYASPVPPCTQVVASCSPRPASLSPRPRSFLPFGLHSLTPSCTLHPPAPSCSFAHAFLRFGPLPLALLTLPALLPVQKKTPEGLAFGGFRLLSVANYFARAFRLTSLAALSASFGFFEMALLSCASAAVRSPSLTAMTARR